jgi:hypothetical protein
MQAKPGNVQTIAIIMIISGVINILAGISLTLAIVLGTLFIGIICVPLTMIPIGVGIYEIIVGANILNNKPAKNVFLVGILEIASILWANFLTMVAGILVLVFYNDPETKAYFEDLNQDTISG